MICPNCQAKFNGFRMGKEKEQHIIKCGNCDKFLIPTTQSYNALNKKKTLGMLAIGALYVLTIVGYNVIFANQSDWYFYSLLIIGAIVGSKFYVMYYKKNYESTVKFEQYDVRQVQKCDIDT